MWSTFGPTDNLWFGGFDDRGPVGECNTALDRDGSPAFPCAWGWETGEAWAYANWYSVAMGLLEPEEGGEQAARS